MSKLAETDYFLIGRQGLFFELGRMYEQMQMIDEYNDILYLVYEKYLNDCFELWFEYYGVGE